MRALEEKMKTLDPEQNKVSEFFRYEQANKIGVR